MSFFRWLVDVIWNIDTPIPHRDEQESIPEKCNKFGIIECEVEDLQYLETETCAPKTNNIRTIKTNNDGEILSIHSDRPEGCDNAT